jgi:hypothetical protein
MKTTISRRTSIVVCVLIAAGLLSYWWINRKPWLSEPKMEQAARWQANECAQALLHGDVTSLVAKMPSKVVKMFGGKEAVIRTTQNDMAQFKAQGFILHSVVIGDVTEIRISHSEVFVLIPETIDMTMPGGILRTESWLVGVSDDGGRTWAFVDSAGLSKIGDVRSVFPNFPTDLYVPKPEAPTVIRRKAHSAASTTQTATQKPTVEIERAFYKVRVPAGCTINPALKNLDLDHCTEVNLSDVNVIIFRVLDDKGDADDLMKQIIDSAAKKMSSPSTMPSDLFSAFHGSGTVLTGIIFFNSQCLEFGRIDGKTRAYIIVTNYAKSDQDQTRQALREVLKSFEIKE